MIQRKRNEQVKSPAKVALLVITLISVVCCCIAIGLAIRDTLFIRNATRTFGRVVDLDESTDNDGNTTYHPVFAFLDQNGQEHGTRSDSGSNPASYELGDTVPVLYRTANPNDAKIDTFWQIWGIEFVLGIIGVILAGIAGLIYLAKARRSASVRQGFGKR